MGIYRLYEYIIKRNNMRLQVFFQIFNNEKIKKTLSINIVKIQCL